MFLKRGNTLNNTLLHKYKERKNEKTQSAVLQATEFELLFWF